MMKRLHQHRSIRTNRCLLRAGAVLVSVGLLLSACGGSATSHGTGSGAVKRGGTLTVALAVQPDSLDPDYAPAAVDYRVMRAIFDSLVEETPQHTFKPWLASSWSVNSDGTQYTFQLRQGVTFQDGTPFNAAAVCYNFNRIVNPAEQSRYAISLLGPYKSCSAPSTSTAVVTLLHPYSPFLESLSQAFLGMVSPTAAAKYGPDFGRHPVGTGPFSFVSETLNQNIILAANPAYRWAPADAGHQGPPYLSGIQFKIVPDPSTRIGSLQSGQLDAAETLPFNQYSSLKADNSLHLYDVAEPGAPYQLFFNTSKAPFNSLAMRTAIRDAIDVPSIVSSLYFGVESRAWGPLAPTTLGYDSSVQNNWSYDPAKAKAILDSQGWKMGANGYRSKNGQELTVTKNDITPDRTQRQEIATFVQQEMKNIGIRMTLNFLPIAPTVTAVENGNYDLQGLSLVSGDPNVMFSQWHSKFIPKPGKFGFNYSHTDSPTMDGYLVAGQTSTGASRDSSYASAQRFVIDNVLSVPIYVSHYTFATRANVHGMSFDARSYPVFYRAWVS